MDKIIKPLLLFALLIRSFAQIPSREFALLIRNFAFLIFNSVSVLAAANLHHSYAVKANAPTGKTGYAYGILQYDLFASKLFSNYDSLFISFDTEALYAQLNIKGGILPDFVYTGINGKIHLSDWNNLYHPVNTETGEEQIEYSLTARSYSGGIYSGIKTKKNIYAALFGEYQTCDLQSAERVKNYSNFIKILQSPAWLSGGVRFGYYNLYPILPQIEAGRQIAAKITYYSSTRPYEIQKDGKLSQLENKNGFQATVTLNESKRFFNQNFFWNGTLNGLLYAYGQSSKTADSISAASIGSSEKKYGRLAGFSFSEIRTNSFVLLNQDVLVTLYKPISLYLWIVWDVSLSETKQKPLALDTGSGLGLYWMPIAKYLAVFFRVDGAITAKRIDSKIGDYLQLYFGLAGQF